jgi:Tfp pilus assembly protein PilO
MNAVRFTKAAPDRVSLVGLGTLLLITTAAGIWLFAPLARTQRASAASRLDLSHDRIEIQNGMDQAHRLRQALAMQAVQLKAAQVGLLDPSRINERIANLSDLAADAGLSIQQIQPGTAVVVGPHDRVPIRILALGTYPTCVRFVHRLSEQLADVAVESFEVSRVDQGGHAKAQLRVDLVWYAAAAGAAANPERP